MTEPSHFEPGALPSNPDLALAEIVRRHPFPEYQEWWPLSHDFIALMQRAILPTWRSICPHPDDLQRAARIAAEYIKTVYARPSDQSLVREFAETGGTRAFLSGEFDAISYALFRTAFESLLSRDDRGALRAFTKSTGSLFFTGLAAHLQMDIPEKLNEGSDLEAMQTAIDRVGEFLTRAGYLRDRFGFTFDVHLDDGGRRLAQSRSELIGQLQRGEPGYALYTMGMPVILPSAVYLYHTLGEAQHHSSRTIEELFARAGCIARETDDFDPAGHRPGEVVELWEIRRN